MRAFYIILSAWMLLPLLMLSQASENVFFDRITSENIKVQKGLSQNTVYTIIQDQDGFMWFGTWDGLNKYDGKKFTIYNKVNGLASETIYALMQSSDGTIWIGTEDGLNTFDPETGVIRSYRNKPADTTSISNNWINQIYEDHNGRILVATGRGLNIYNPDKDAFRQHLIRKRDNTSIRSNWINELFQDADGSFWYATRHGLVRYDTNARVTTRFFHKPGDPNSLADNFTNTIAKDADGNLWVGTRSGLSKLDKHTKKFVNYYHDPRDPSSLSGNHISDIHLDRKGKLWIATDGGGLSAYDPRGDAFEVFRHNSNNANSISNNRVFEIFEDDIGTLWLGTFKGVSKIDEHASKFKVFRNDPESPNSLNNNFVRDFLEVEKGVIWMATEGGINIYNEGSGDFTFMKSSPGRENTLPSNNIRDIFRDSFGDFWLGTSDSGVIRYQKDEKLFSAFSHNPSDTGSLNANFVQITYEDRDKNIWVATSAGLNRFERDRGKFTRFDVIPDDPSTEKFSRIYDMYQDSSGTLWFASQAGLTKYEPGKGVFSSVYIQPDDSNTVVSNKLFSIHDDGRGNFWLGTRGGGLVKYNLKNNGFKIYTEEDGLPNNVVYGFLEDRDGNYWISTNWGLSKFDPVQESFVNYDVKDGLQSYEFNGNALLKAESGRMYFGGMNGFNSFFPSDISVNKNIPPVEITGFSVFNEALPYQAARRDTIRLNHDDNFFSFEFAALDFTNPSKNKYRYMLEGVDKSWRETDAGNPRAEYTKLSPGTYTFKVLGSNNDGYWNTEGDEMVVVITPPWWQNWFFRGAVIFLLLALIWLFIYLRIKRIKKKHETDKKVLELEKQMFDIEQKALQLQMNPHFIFNSLNSIQSFVLKNDTDKAINYLAKFSQLMRMMLANSRETYIPIKDELVALQYYMDIEKLRFDNKFDYKVTLAREIDEEFMEIPPMILQPYVENAIIHGLIHSPKRGLINIDFKFSEQKIACTIEDNGVGREKSELIKKESGFNRKSRGLIITKERLELLSRQQKDKFSINIVDLKDSEGSPTGTRVELMILFRES